MFFPDDLRLDRGGNRAQGRASSIAENPSAKARLVVTSHPCMVASV